VESWREAWRVGVKRGELAGCGEAWRVGVNT
jgi:hypothetical protein